MRYGIVPAGGLGTRSGLSHSKELALVYGRPVIEYIFDRLDAAGIRNIIVTLAPGKEDLIAYLSGESPYRSRLLLQTGQRRGLFRGIVDPAERLNQQDELFFGLPDTIWYPEDAYRRISIDTNSVTLGLLPSETPEKFGSVVLEHGKIKTIVEKPRKPESPWIWAFGKIRVSAVPELVRLSEEFPVFTELLGAYANKFPVGVCTFSGGQYFDTGTPAGLAGTDKFVRSLIK